MERREDMYRAPLALVEGRIGPPIDRPRTETLNRRERVKC